ncbi:MAG: putative toxin-antitoxin system toxin component, PIN family [Anaerolineae bacterium]
MIKAVLDTDVFLRVLINPHSRCGRLLDEFADDHELVLSPAIVHEVLEVLHWPRLRAKFSQIAQLNMARIISLFEQAQIVEPQDVPSVSRDPRRQTPGLRQGCRGRIFGDRRQGPSSVGNWRRHPDLPAR